MRIAIVVAASTNNVIGAQGSLPWHLPEDLRHFRQLTMGKPIVMGRRTFASIGRPLPGRRNIVISRQHGLSIAGCEVASSPQAALALAPPQAEIMVIGGERIYEAFLARASLIHMTRVHAVLEGDAFFPELWPEEWRVVAAEDFAATHDRPLAFTFQTLQRL